MDACADTGVRMERVMRIDEVLNQSPPYVDVNLYDSDQPLQDAVAANGGERDASALSGFGRHWGTAEMFDLARAANEHSPELKAFDAKDFRRDAIEFHPAYHQLMTEIVSAGLTAWCWRRRRAGLPVFSCRGFGRTGRSTGFISSASRTSSAIARTRPRKSSSWTLSPGASARRAGACAPSSIWCSSHGLIAPLLRPASCAWRWRRRSITRATAACSKNISSSSR